MDEHWGPGIRQRPGVHWALKIVFKNTPNRFLTFSVTQIKAKPTVCDVLGNFKNPNNRLLKIYLNNLAHYLL